MELLLEQTTRIEQYIISQNFAQPPNLYLELKSFDDVVALVD